MARQMLFWLLFVFVQFVFCSNGLDPIWTKKLPVAMSESYYYKVGQATGATEEEAIRNAYNLVLSESSDAIKTVFNSSGNSKKGMLHALKVNKVCQFTEDLIVRNGYRAYVLCQVAKSFDISPDFKSFDCNSGKEY
jgi:hypothetical protein